MDLPPGTLLPFQLKLSSQRILQPVVREESIASIRRSLGILHISAVICVTAFLLGNMFSYAPAMAISGIAVVGIIVATVLTMWRARPSNWPARLDAYRHFDLRAAERGLAAIFATDHQAIDVFAANGASVTVRHANKRDDGLIVADLFFRDWDISGEHCPEWHIRVGVIRADELPPATKPYRLETAALQEPPSKSQIRANLPSVFTGVRPLSQHEKLQLTGRTAAISLPEERASVRRM